MTTPEGDNFIITTENGEYIEGTKEEILQPLTSIIIEPESIELQIGEKKTITAKINPEKAYNKKLNWIIGNEDIAAVGDQKVNADGTISVEITAKETGTTTVIAKAKDGSEVQGSCIITVEKQKFYLYNSGESYNAVTGGWITKWEDASVPLGSSRQYME